MSLNDILELHGLSDNVLRNLSYKSSLGISLKKNLHHFNKEELINELSQMADWYDEQELLDDIALDYRIKSIDSIIGKYNRYYPDTQVRKTFNDILGFRAFCDDYSFINNAGNNFRIADMSYGKANDDGYRGVHVYFQIDNHHYPIEIQFNTFYDRQINNWLHEYLYKKKEYPNTIGQIMRQQYEAGKIKNSKDFEEVLANVLSNC